MGKSRTYLPWYCVPQETYQPGPTNSSYECLGDTPQCQLARICIALPKFFFGIREADGLPVKVPKEDIHEPRCGRQTCFSGYSRTYKKCVSPSREASVEKSKIRLVNVVFHPEL